MGPDPGSASCHVAELRQTYLLEGASNAASVGLDIGGTLCKVVFFEPDNAVNGSIPSAQYDREVEVDTEGPGVSGRRNECQDSPEGICGVSELRGRVNGQRGAALRTLVEETNLENSRSSSSDHSRQLEDGNGKPGSENVQNGAEGHDGVAGTSRQETSGGNILEESKWGSPEGSEQPPPRKRDGGNGDRASEDSSEKDRCRDGSGGGVDDVENLWMSSHEPIVLPGKGTLHFKRFETWRVEDFLALTRTHSLVSRDKVIGATGGGAKKFAHVFHEQAGIQLRKEDELKCLLKGIDFLVRHAEDDSFEYEIDAYRGGAIQRPLHSPEHSDDGSGDDRRQHKAFPSGKGSLARGIRSSSLTRLGAALEGAEESAYPYLVVNIGSGVSILRVDGRHVYERVGGTSLGGSTFLGLVSALTGCKTFREAIAMAAGGDSTNVDMLVGDIYGGDYTEMGLAATVVASSFGKLVQPGGDGKVAASPADLAKACLLMVTNNVGSLAMLHAKAAGVKRILFAGSFLHGNKVAMKLLSVAVEFWSKGVMKAVFLRHEGHAGAIGALLSGLDEAFFL
ncbi:pantothenate kinase [Klebsormidium nitens]|uniref:pantothenate kinase n=1 Tax=Klebsormidium nitens TaxID=105231 RepID=A0A1Y1HXK7_KLENI|nr:pantothenate kinase [Klebsormidium nitens]|eukprot:GAQ81909.1 pantothenate kinase [Klebsormidium nitens]